MAASFGRTCSSARMASFRLLRGGGRRRQTVPPASAAAAGLLRPLPPLLRSHYEQKGRGLFGSAELSFANDRRLGHCLPLRIGATQRARQEPAATSRSDTPKR